MKIGIIIDYGSFANATSLNLIAKKVFLEIGKIMNEKKDFTITALRYDDIGIGDVNQHYDCIYIPNMGGYKFPSKGIMTSNNIVIGLVGIDEVVLGDKVFRTKIDWERSKPIIENEIPKWEEGSKNINVIHVATQSEKEQMVKYLKISEGKIKIIPLGVDKEKFFPVKDKKNARRKILGRFFLKDGPYFIHVSESNWARKNVFRVLDAYEKIRKKEGIKEKLIIVGRVEPEVVKRADEIDNVKVLGFVDERDLVRLIQNAEAMIFPSLHEGFGLPSVEAIACGIPVIASNVFSSPEVLGKGAVLVDPYNVNDIAEKIGKISLDSDFKKKMANEALLQSEKYSWRKTGETILALIKKSSNQKSNFNFEYAYELAVRRTLATLSEMIPELHGLSRSEFLEFNYSTLINWCIYVGINDDRIKDFIVPYKKWLEKNRGERNE